MFFLFRFVFFLHIESRVWYTLVKNKNTSEWGKNQTIILKYLFYINKTCKL